MNDVIILLGLKFESPEFRKSSRLNLIVNATLPGIKEINACTWHSKFLGLTCSCFRCTSYNHFYYLQIHPMLCLLHESVFCKIQYSTSACRDTSTHASSTRSRFKFMITWPRHLLCLSFELCIDLGPPISSRTNPRMSGPQLTWPKFSRAQLSFRGHGLFFKEKHHLFFFRFGIHVPISTYRIRSVMRS